MAVSDQSVPDETRVTIRFDVPLSLRDALSTSEVHGYPVNAYRFENPEVVGEFSIHGGQSPEDFLKGFSDMYGTSPQIVGVVVTVPSEVAKSWSEQKSASSLSVRASAAPYTAPPASPAKIDALLREARAANPDLDGRSPGEFPAQGDVTRAAISTWKPTQAEIQIFRPNSSTVYFSQYYYWDGVTAKTTGLHPDDGFEAEVNIYTDDLDMIAAGVRPDCGVPNYKDRPFAKNYGWTWSALVNTGSGMGSIAASVRAYADYNDLSDDCHRNSMGIGIRTPQAIPSYPSGMQEILLTIQAPRGGDNTGKIDGVVQAVNETWCNLNTWLSDTDCMGVSSSSSGARSTLAGWREWTAPNKCWRSLDYGNVAPVAYPC